MDKLIIAAIVLLLSKTYEAGPRPRQITTTPSPYPNYEVKMFMNYSDGIWTVNSTANSTVWCMVDRTANITGNMIYFNRSFVDGGGQWVDERYQGNVSSTENATMLVGLQGAAPSTVETLWFATNNYSCGVFQVTLPNGATGNLPPQWFDLRVRNNSLSEIPPDCEAKFKEYCGNFTIFQYYNDTCQDNTRHHILA